MNTATAFTLRARWKSQVLFVFVACAVLAGGFLIAFAISPSGTQRSYIVMADGWYKHWPLKRGKSILFRLNDTLYRAGVMKPVVAQTQQGITMELDSRDLVTQTILTDGIWEPKVTSLVNENLAEGGVFVDVGAHVGYYSLLASRKVGIRGKVVAVEPNPPTIARLERNINLNHAENILVQKVACTDKETTLRFFQAGVENTGGSSMNQANVADGHEISVPGVPLDQIVRSLGLSRVDLIKIDVEGAEMQVLSGMTYILTTYRPKIVVEIQPDHLAAAKALFQNNGYRLQERDAVDNYFWTPAAPPPAAR